MKNVLEINSLVLAYLGDDIYEEYIRRYLVDKGIASVDALQKEAIKYVSATAQSKYLDELINSDFLTENELEIVKRARNCKINSHPKNTSLADYKKATGLEALIGYYDYISNEDRIKEIIKRILGE